MDQLDPKMLAQIKEAIRAPFTLGGTIDADGKLPPGAEDNFVNLAVNEAPSVSFTQQKNRICLLEFTQHETSYIDNIDLPIRSLRRNVPGTTFTTLTNPELERITLLVAQTMLAYDLPWVTIEDNIERGTLPQLLTSLYATGFGNDIEDLLWNGDTTDTSGGDTQTFLRLYDGVRQLMLAGTSNATIMDTNGNTDFLNVVFPQMIRSLPSKYQADRSKLILTTSVASLNTYLEQHIARQTVRSEQTKEDAFVPPILGVQVVSSPKIVEGQHYLSTRNNARFRVLRGMKVFSENVPRKAAWENTLSARFAIGIGNTAACVIAEDRP